jgi:hypothetical protein
MVQVLHCIIFWKYNSTVNFADPLLLCMGTFSVRTYVPDMYTAFVMCTHSYVLLFSHICINALGTYSMYIYGLACVLVLRGNAIDTLLLERSNEQGRFKIIPTSL